MSMLDPCCANTPPSRGWRRSANCCMTGVVQPICGRRAPSSRGAPTTDEAPTESATRRAAQSAGRPSIAISTSLAPASSAAARLIGIGRHRQPRRLSPDRPRARRCSADLPDQGRREPGPTDVRRPKLRRRDGGAGRAAFGEPQRGRARRMADPTAPTWALHLAANLVVGGRPRPDPAVAFNSSAGCSRY